VERDIAETGSVVFHTAADMPILLNFLPAVHIVAVRASSILSDREDLTGSWPAGIAQDRSHQRRHRLSDAKTAG